MTRENISHEASSVLLEGMDFEKKGNRVNAESCFERAINLSNPNVMVFITAKKYLAEVKQSQDKMEEADKLKEEAEAGIMALGSAAADPISCNCGPGLRWAGRQCIRCSPSLV